MKVFACKRQGGYSGGLIIVAAETKEEAFLIAAMDEKTSWMFEWCDEDGMYCEPDWNIDHVRSCYYPLDKWEEVENLFTDLKIPQVILENGHSE